MSQEDVLTGKAKKAKRSEERSKKGSKRKREATAEDAEITQDTGVTEQDGDEATATAPTKPKSKKRRRAEGDSAQAEDMPEGTDGQKDGGETKPAKRKNQKQPPSSAEGQATGEGGVDGDATAAVAADADAAETTDQAPVKQRFIVFIGNLPFTTTTEMLEKHFASITPTSTRHLTDPKTKKSKGYAFLEFSNYDRMKTCLKLYHHSTFDTGVGGERGKRRINVELTAGGGGKSEGRKEKLKVKNERLEDQRKRRAEALAKEEKRKGSKGAKEGAGPGAPKAIPAPGRAPGMATGDAESTGIHPSRLAQMNGR